MGKKILSILVILLIISGFTQIDNGSLHLVNEAEFIIDVELYREWEFLILVNEDNMLDKTYNPQHLIEVNKYLSVNDSRTYYLQQEVVTMLVKLMNSFYESLDYHIDVRVTSAFRSFQDQQLLYESFSPEIREGLVAKPGSSEHHTGLAVDIAEAGVVKNNLENTTFYKFLEQNAHDFGFIIRYPKDKGDITGVQFEPWHLRYVGRAHARRMKELGLTLEEYWQYLQSNFCLITL